MSTKKIDSDTKQLIQQALEYVERAKGALEDAAKNADKGHFDVHVCNLLHLAYTNSHNAYYMGEIALARQEILAALSKKRKAATKKGKGKSRG